ncbi:SRR1 family protein [Hymenobacter pini]|uniref:SRR1 family protein n=1 Tax=Hymenobacter pini TaxID=2880879 RepID=UPI001CF32FE9|nr:SRR1 family protein [Hymenobacter pini]MCA8830489.1 SRR1 family protein [Hymenobacter pini]
MVPTTACPTTGPAHLKNTALWKARVYWSHVNPGQAGQMDFYSFDSSGRFAVADPARYGLAGLRKLVDKLGAKVARCVIYENLTAGRPEYCRKENGTWTR